MSERREQPPQQETPNRQESAEERFGGFDFDVFLQIAANQMHLDTDRIMHVPFEDLTPEEQERIERAEMMATKIAEAAAENAAKNRDEARLFMSDLSDFVKRHPLLVAGLALISGEVGSLVDAKLRSLNTPSAAIADTPLEKDRDVLQIPVEMQELDKAMTRERMYAFLDTYPSSWTSRLTSIKYQGEVPTTLDQYGLKNAITAAWAQHHPEYETSEIVFFEGSRQQTWRDRFGKTLPHEMGHVAMDALPEELKTALRSAVRGRLNAPDRMDVWYYQSIKNKDKALEEHLKINEYFGDLMAKGDSTPPAELAEVLAPADLDIYRTAYTSSNPDHDFDKAYKTREAVLYAMEEEKLWAWADTLKVSPEERKEIRAWFEVRRKGMVEPNYELRREGLRELTATFLAFNGDHGKREVAQTAIAMYRKRREALDVLSRSTSREALFESMQAYAVAYGNLKTERFDMEDQEKRQLLAHIAEIVEKYDLPIGDDVRGYGRGRTLDTSKNSSRDAREDAASYIEAIDWQTENDPQWIIYALGIGQNYTAGMGGALLDAEIAWNASQWRSSVENPGSKT